MESQVPHNSATNRQPEMRLRTSEIDTAQSGLSCRKAASSPQKGWQKEPAVCPVLLPRAYEKVDRFH